MSIKWEKAYNKEWNTGRLDMYWSNEWLIIGMDLYIHQLNFRLIIPFPLKKRDFGFRFSFNFIKIWIGNIALAFV